MLLVAPLSGHFATLLRATVRTMLPDHDVYITDWHNARDVPLTAGRFGFDEYVDHLIKFLEVIGPGAHVLAVCQPCVAVLAAVAVMAQDGNPAQPRSMTLMAGPIDTRVNPTKVNELANKRIDRLVRAHADRVGAAALSGRVPPRLSGLRPARRLHEHEHRAPREGASTSFTRISPMARLEKAAATKAFYDEYFAVLDLTAEFYLETVRLVFQEHALPLGKLQWHGEPRRPERDPPHHAAHGRGRARRHLRGRPDRGGARSVQQAAPVSASATTCRPASAITACSPASAGRTKFIRL